MRPAKSIEGRDVEQLRLATPETARLRPSEDGRHGRIEP